MTQALHQLTASMVNQLNRVDTISNNLANANTTGFKQDNLAEGSFNNYLKRKEIQNEDPTDLSTLMNTIPKISGSYVNGKAGAIRATGNKFDFALTKEDTFFKLKLPDGNFAYTRDGSFKTLNGNLVNQDGYNVIGLNNKPISTDNKDFNKQIIIYKIKFENLKKIGDNNYTIKNKNDIATVKLHDENMVIGSIEASNVNTMVSMVSLIEAQRKFEQSQKALTGVDEINKKVIDSIGNGR